MTLHADAHSVLSRWAAPDDEQERLRVTYLAHLDGHADATSRDCHPDHLTASALIFSADHQQVLLTLHHVIKRWLQTGGHCDPEDESLADAALREAHEESGIDGPDDRPRTRAAVTPRGAEMRTDQAVASPRRAVRCGGPA